MDVCQIEFEMDVFQMAFQMEEFEMISIKGDGMYDDWMQSVWIQ